MFWIFIEKNTKTYRSYRLTDRDWNRSCIFYVLRKEVSFILRRFHCDRLLHNSDLWLETFENGRKDRYRTTSAMTRSSINQKITNKSLFTTRNRYQVLILIAGIHGMKVKAKFSVFYTRIHDCIQFCTLNNITECKWYKHGRKEDLQLINCVQI